MTDWSGNLTLHVGPCKIPYFPAKVRKASQHVATVNEYLVVHKKSGEVEVLPGPTSIWQNPGTMISVAVHSATKVGEQEVIVVYRPASLEAGGKDVGEDVGKLPPRSIVRDTIVGPGMYVPSTASEWLHEFVWSGRQSAARAEPDCGRKAAGALRFTKLRLCPGKTYYDVENVRTTDGATLTIKLMVFYHIVDVTEMLAATSDPMADLFAALAADVIEFCAPLRLEEALCKVETLNSLDTYAQLSKVAKTISMNVSRVVFRGYCAPLALQRLHDGAIESRTQLKLTAERISEEERQADERLAAGTRRANEEIALKRKREEEDRQQLQERARMDLAIQAAKDDQETSTALVRRAGELAHLRELKQLDERFNIGEYMIAKDTPKSVVVQCNGLLLGGDSRQLRPEGARSAVADADAWVCASTLTAVDAQKP